MIYEGKHIPAAIRSTIGIILADKKQILILLDTG